MEPKEILKILSDNGFDWFGEERSLVREVDSSLAALSTNKSFLGAIIKINNPCRGCPECGSSGCAGYGIIQDKLIQNITYHNGNGFWNIIAEFMGVTDDK